MTVSRGTIYGLLGASGCGKTTLLSCILGQRKLNSGTICVLGEALGTKNSGACGHRIGYMPQETALYGDFSVRETLTYFGWIAGMNNKRIQQRFETLEKLFLFPDGNQLVKTLSGGQQRRVSLAAALLHEPELLILDEPTIGVGPILREAIWSHLYQISREENRTIIITTHYIEEARQVHTVGLMRGGQFLAEEAPEKLIRKFNCQTLEEVFLKLSVAQDLNQQQSTVTISESKGITSRGLTEDSLINSQSCISSDNNDMPAVKISDYLPVLKLNNLKALIWKNILWWKRNVPALIFMTGLPGLVIALFCLSIGQDPRGLVLAVVNHETNNSADCNTTLYCNSRQLSCAYLENLKRNSLILTYYNLEDEARKSVFHGETIASIMVRRNYSAAFRARIEDSRDVKPWDIDFSEIDVFRDLSNRHIADYLKVHLYDSFQNFTRDYLVTCNMPSRSLKLPISWESPIYGERYPNFADFSLPGMLITITFISAVLLTSCAMLVEQNEGSLERTFVVGINKIELIVAHIACESVIMAIQVIGAITCAFAIFDMTQRGSFVLVVLLTLLSGFCGMCYGILISCICESDTAVSVVATGTFFPMIMLSGVIWPIESVHYLLKPVAIGLPLSKAIEALRSVLQRSWSLSAEAVYMGFISLCVWTAIFLLISFLYLRLKKD